MRKDKKKGLGLFLPYGGHAQTTCFRTLSNEHTVKNFESVRQVFLWESETKFVFCQSKSEKNFWQRRLPQTLTKLSQINSEFQAQTLKHIRYFICSFYYAWCKKTMSKISRLGTFNLFLVPISHLLVPINGDTRVSVVVLWQRLHQTIPI